MTDPTTPLPPAPFHLVLGTGAVAGGSWNRLVELVRYLGQRGHTLDLITYRSDNADALAREVGALRYHPIDIAESERGTARLTREMWTRLRSIDTDSGRPVWLGSYAANGGVALALSRSRFARRSVGPVRMFTFLRGAEEHRLRINEGRKGCSELRARLKFLGHRTATTLQLRASDLLIVQSEAGAARIVESYGDAVPARRVVLPNNLNASWITAKVRAVAHQPALPDLRAFTIGFVGRFNAVVKGLDTLVEVADRTRDLDLHFDLAGDGDDRRAVEARVEARGLAERFTFHGWMDNPLQVLARADLVVVPSRADPFPNVILEALALGRPVLCSAVDGIPSMLVHDALLLPPGDARAWARRVRALATSTADLDHAAGLAAARAEQFRFDWGARFENLLLDTPAP